MIHRVTNTSSASSAPAGGNATNTEIDDGFIVDANGTAFTGVCGDGSGPTSPYLLTECSKVTVTEKETKISFGITPVFQAAIASDLDLIVGTQILFEITSKEKRVKWEDDLDRNATFVSQEEVDKASSSTVTVKSIGIGAQWRPVDRFHINFYSAGSISAGGSFGLNNVSLSAQYFFAAAGKGQMMEEEEAAAEEEEAAAEEEAAEEEE